MNFQMNNWIKLNLKIFLLGLTVTILSFVPDLPGVRHFFGDVYGQHDDGWNGTYIGWNWSYRHHVFFWTCFVMFILQLVRIVIFIVEWYEQYEKAKK